MQNIYKILTQMHRTILMIIEGHIQCFYRTQRKREEKRIDHDNSLQVPVINIQRKKHETDSKVNKNHTIWELIVNVEMLDEEN